MRKHIVLLLSALLLCCAAAVAQDYTPASVTVSQEKVKLNGKMYYSHLVLERQTVYSIAKAYGVTEEDLYEANPALREKGLKAGSILLVPVRSQAEVIQAEPQPQAYKEHTVRWYEDIDDIARRYGVSVEAIISFNGLKGRKLNTRQVLRIPDASYRIPDPETGETPAEPQPQDTVQATQPAQDTLAWRPQRRDEVSFSLLLPLKAETGGSDSNMDFYSGVLMALRDLEAEGVKVDLHVYDLHASVPDVETLAREDFVLGPVASRDLEGILQMTGGRVPVISPLDQKAASLSSLYQNFIQAPAGVDNQYEDLAAWVQEDCQAGDKVFLVTEKNATNSQAAVGIRTAMANRGLNYEILSYRIAAGRAIPDTLGRAMVKNGTNRVVVASESEPFVGDVVRNLGIMLGRGCDVVMYAPSKVRNFDSIDGSALHDLACHISTSYHVNYGSTQVDRFIHEYRALFRTEPNQFAYQGYDTARYFVSCVARYGYSWTRHMSHTRSRGLHTDFLFENDGDENHHNTAIRRIVYQPDYTTVLLY